ncbi:MAG TPA: 4Fe-4S binding protein [Dehalococcoidia bacterium]|nr:4Fe-4S binding protein [Dehalococcoidia bacterium]
MQHDPMTMAGISLGVFLGAAAGLVALSLVIPWWLEARQGNPHTTSAGYPKLDLLGNATLRALVRARPFQFLLRLPVVLLFLLIIFAGLFGTQAPDKNIAPVLTWTIWWASLMFFILFLGKIWCLVCPWNALAEWLQRFTLWGKKETTLSLNFRWPRKLRNIYLATGLFVGLSWLELGFGVTLSPMATAGLGLFILALTVVPALYYDRKPFCRYGCLVGQISGLYALFSPAELRARDREVCRTVCRTKDCLLGNERGYGCPINEYLGAMDLNTYCIVCSECVKTCPHDNVAFNLRPFAVDLVKSFRLRRDEAYLALTMLSLTIFHGITMPPPWGNFVMWLRDNLGMGDLGQVVAFSLGMAGILAVPVLLFLGVAWVSRRFARLERPFRDVFIGYTYALLPVALMYHTAHNLQHFLREGQKLIPLLSDPLGWGWDLFGTAAWNVAPLASLGSIQYAQVALVVLGHAFAVYVAYHIARRQSTIRAEATRSLAPILTIVLGFSLMNLWLLAQPMQMRSAM